jgi:hypothetical protein
MVHNGPKILMRDMNCRCDEALKQLNSTCPCPFIIIQVEIRIEQNMYSFPVEFLPVQVYMYVPILTIIF